MPVMANIKQTLLRYNSNGPFSWTMMMRFHSYQHGKSSILSF